MVRLSRVLLLSGTLAKVVNANLNNTDNDIIDDSNG